MSMPTLHIASPFSTNPVAEAHGDEISSNARSTVSHAQSVDDAAYPAVPTRSPQSQILPPGASSAMDLVASIPVMTEGSRAPLKTVTEEYGRGASEEYGRDAGIGALAEVETGP